jgi:tetratricopeptide (TPR) repeat protein
MSVWQHTTPDEFSDKYAAMTTAAFDAVSGFPFSPRQKEILAKLKKGVPLTAILGIERHHRDALLARACLMFKTGQFARAYDLFRFLYVLQPLDARVVYGLAATLQVRGSISESAKAFLIFIALDATNADGHLRLAECLMTLREFDEAAKHLQVASRFAKTEAQKGQAARLLAHIEGVLDAALDIGRQVKTS